MTKEVFYLTLTKTRTSTKWMAGPEKAFYLYMIIHVSVCLSVPKKNFYRKLD